MHEIFVRWILFLYKHRSEAPRGSYTFMAHENRCRVEMFIVTAVLWKRTLASKFDVLWPFKHEAGTAGKPVQ
jgi:hypothetical protein